MIDKTELIKIGNFQKTHALKGELNAILQIDEAYFEEGNPFIIDMEGLPVPFYAQTIRKKGSTSFLVKLDGIDNMDLAKDFVNKDIYATKERLKEYLDDEENEIYAIDGFENFRIFDTEGNEIGTIERVDNTTENILFIVITKEGSTVYIPAVEDFIETIDEEKKEIIMNLPDGLLDINNN